eukprot:21101-Heterococcus_DN1.PRE.1
MTAVGYDPILTDTAARAAGIEPVPLEEIFKRSDFISLHAPLTLETRNLINTARTNSIKLLWLCCCQANLAKCKKGVRIVNCARGQIINATDLLAALESGQHSIVLQASHSTRECAVSTHSCAYSANAAVTQAAVPHSSTPTLSCSSDLCCSSEHTCHRCWPVAGAALDVYPSEPPPAELNDLVRHPNVICTPHLGASTTDAQLAVTAVVYPSSSSRSAALVYAQAAAPDALAVLLVLKTPVPALQSQAVVIETAAMIYVISKMYLEHSVRVAKDIATQMCDVLDGGEFVGVLNAPNMAFARKSKLSSYVKLGEKMGALQAQLLGHGKALISQQQQQQLYAECGHIMWLKYSRIELLSTITLYVRSMRITLHGKDLAVPEMTGPMSAAVLKGALNHLLAQEVNYVNAVALAKDLGLAIEVAFTQAPCWLVCEYFLDNIPIATTATTGTTAATEDPSGYTNGLTVEFEIDGVLNGKRAVAGTCFGKELRVTAIDGMSIDFQPTGDIVFLNNPDTPGMLKQVSAVLAQGSVNIANFALGRVRQ